LHDAIVIGGGPVGSYVARKMAETGRDVVVLEKRESAGEQVCCTGIISRKCLDDFNIDSNLVLKKANSARIFSPSGKSIHLYRHKNQACVIDRAAFDSSMIEKAKIAGAGYVFDSTAEDIKQQADRIVVEASDSNNKSEYEARVVVIAAGFGSKLIGRAGLGEYSDIALGAQVEVGNPSVDEIEVYTGGDVTNGFFAWLVPTFPQKALVGLLSRHNPREYLKKLLISLQKEGKIHYDGAKINIRGITIKPPQRTYGQRLIVVGDAAGQIKPTTGGGIYFGLLSAEIAAGNLITVLEKNDLSAKRLSRYQREWKKELGQELKISYWARKIYERLSDEQIDKIFDITIDKGIDKSLLEDEDLSFDWHGRAILRLARQRALAKPLKVMKIPLTFLTGRGN
jgi:geranylgeranyl reductase family protein